MTSKIFLLSIACCLNALQGESSLHWSRPVSSVSVVTLTDCWLTVAFLLKSMMSAEIRHEGGFFKPSWSPCLMRIEVVCRVFHKLLQPRGNPVHSIKGLTQHDAFRREKCNNGCSLFKIGFKISLLHIFTWKKKKLVKQSLEKLFKRNT